MKRKPTYQKRNPSKIGKRKYMLERIQKEEYDTMLSEYNDTNKTEKNHEEKE